MAMWTAYHDASGSEHTSRKAPMAIAGLCSTELGWLQFEGEWEAVLNHRRFNVPYLHMKEFAHSTPGSPFESWKGQEEKRAAFLAALTNVMAKYVKRCQVLYVGPGVYEAANAKFRIDDGIAGTYSLAAFIGYTQVLRWMDEKHPREPLEQFFEAGDRGQGRFTEIFRKEMGLTDTFPLPIIKEKVDPRTGRRIRPFEAADFLAYEWALVSHRYEQNIRKSRQSFLGIFKKVKVNYMTATLEKLTEMCEAAPDLYPPR